MNKNSSKYCKWIDKGILRFAQNDEVGKVISFKFPQILLQKDDLRITPGFFREELISKRWIPAFAGMTIRLNFPFRVRKEE